MSATFDTPANSTGHYLSGSAGRLHYLDYGTVGKPTMLFVHGAAAHAHWFDYVAPGFSADYHVLSLDLRGHGNSAWSTSREYSYEHFATDVAAVAEQLDLRDFVLVGHSMGGLTSVMYAASRPARLGRLVIVDARPKLPEEAIANLRNYSSQEAKKYSTMEDLVDRYRLQPAGTTAAPNVIRDMAHKGAKQNDDGSWGHKFDRALHVDRQVVDGYQYWRKVKVPAYLITGAISTRINPEIYAEMKRCCPQLEMAEVANSDHHVTLDNPSGFVAALRPFLDRTR